LNNIDRQANIKITELQDTSRDDYLSLSTPLVRYLDVFEPQRPLTVAPPLRVLAMAAGPRGLESLDVEHEQNRLDQAPTAHDRHDAT
jgi:hypothetical protein